MAKPTGPGFRGPLRVRRVLRADGAGHKGNPVVAAAAGPRGRHSRMNLPPLTSRPTPGAPQRGRGAPASPAGALPGKRALPGMRPSRGASRKTAVPPRAKPAKPPVRSDADRALVERLLAAAKGGVDVRARKVRRLRAAIKVRAYENDLKLAVAVERLVESLGERLDAAGRRLAQGKSEIRSTAASGGSTTGCAGNPKHALRNPIQTRNPKASGSGGCPRAKK